MKFCNHCGAEINDNAVVCIKCGCSVGNSINQVTGKINPNDAKSIGFAILGFLIPLVGFILFLFWNDSSPKKAKSCGKGALVGYILHFILVPVIFIVSISMIYNMVNKELTSNTITTDIISPHFSISSEFYIGSITTKTRDNATVSVNVFIGYNENEQSAYSVISSRQNELRDFFRRYFSNKYARDLVPEKEEEIKTEIREQLNTNFFNEELVRIVIFNRFDVLNFGF